MRIKGYKIKKGIIFLTVIMIVSLYFLFPQYVTINANNTKGNPITANITIDGKTLQTPVHKWILRQTSLVKVESKYRDTQVFNYTNYWHPIPGTINITMQPSLYNFANTTFIDPNGKQLIPEIKVKGITIDGDPLDIIISVNDKIPYGDYGIDFYTKYFAIFEKIIEPPGKLILQPNENMLVLTKEEAERVMKYFADYLELSEQEIEPLEDYPKQYYIYTKNWTISLGDMLLIICESEKNENYYVPKHSTYTHTIEGECYDSLIEQKVPTTINGTAIEQYIYDKLNDRARTIYYHYEDLNQKQYKTEWALTYDIEYGRYVPKEGLTEATYSTCEIDDSYLTKEQCSDADYAGWVSKTSDEFFYKEYGYPVSSGLIGWRWILELGEDYGLPTTQYMVTKDIDLFMKRDPAVFELSKELVNEGLVEIGSHTRYHTRLDKVEYNIALQELINSKNLLEEAYSVPVTNFRNPYLALVNGNREDNEKALADTGYSTYSLYGNGTKNLVNGKTIEHKPLNYFGYMAYSKPEYLHEAEQMKYVISLDHPWNIQYHELDTEKGIILVESPEQPIQAKAIILQGISDGVRFVKMEDINI